MNKTGFLGKTITIKGEISAEEDLRIDGKVEGKIASSRCLTIGQAGQIHAEVSASRVSLDGKLKGHISATDGVEIGKTASFEGDLVSPRLSIADGAYFKGNVDMTGQRGKADKKGVR